MAAPDESITRLLIDGATAIGTVAVAIIAIWGERIRARFLPAHLHIEPVEADRIIRGQLVPLTPPPNVVNPDRSTHARWYVLKVVNQKRYLTSKNCRVLLKGISRRGPDGAFRPEPFTVPRQYWWAPSESTPAEITLGKEHAFDFGFIGNRDRFFTPTLYSVPNNFPGYVRKDESVRFSLEIDADNFSSPKYQVFEVSWNGQWNDDSDVMARHLTIKEI